MSNRFNIGDKVRLTGKHLRNTGQYTGSAGMDRWIVQACQCLLCATGRFVRTNEKSATFSHEMYADIAGTPEYESVQWIHINVHNLERCK